MNRDLPNPTARPPLRVPRISIGQTMAVVAGCAVLGGAPLECFGPFFFASMILPPLAWLIATVGKTLGENRVPILTTVAALSIMGILALFARSWDTFLLVVLTVVNETGLVVAADRHLHGKPVTSGHLLWAWVGLVWPMPLFVNSTLRGAGPWLLLIACTHLLLAGVILLLAFARRPASVDDTWTDRAGWLVVECDVIAYGWIAAMYLHWV